MEKAEAAFLKVTEIDSRHAMLGLIYLGFWRIKERKAKLKRLMSRIDDCTSPGNET